MYLGVSKIRGTVPQNGWFIMENPITVKWMILGVSLFLKTPIYIYWFRNPKANTYLGCIKKPCKEWLISTTNFPQLVS